VGMVNFAQFTRGMSEVITISGPILEKLFNLMDTNQIGMIDFEKFATVLKADTPSRIPKLSNMA
jgi:Ca2+-binding EF-hand superfamily protein